MLTLLMVTILAAPPDEVLATVDGKPILHSQAVARARATAGAGGVGDLRSLVEDLVNEEVLAGEGYRQGLDKAPAAVAAAEAERRRLAAERLLAKDVYPAVVVEEAAVRQMFHETGDSVRLSAIVLATEDEAKALLERLAKGADWNKEALHSLDMRTARSGGDMGDMTRGQLGGALGEAAFSAPIGKPHGPVRLELGVGVIRVAGRHLADEKGLPARREQIVGFITSQSHQMVRTHDVKTLEGKYKAMLDEAFLKSTGVALNPTPEQAARVVVRVGASQVTYGEVLAALVRTFGAQQSGHVSGPTVKRDVAKSELERLLLEQAAVDAGYGKDPAVVAGVKLVERDQVVRELAARIREATPNPTRPELEAYLAAHAAEYRRPGTRTCSHIVSRTKDQAALLRARLEKGERFDTLAAEYSSDTRTAAKGGVMGVVDDNALAALATKSNEPALSEALRPPVPDAVSQPVQSRAGWHLVRCGAATPPSLPKVDEVQQQVGQRLRTERADEAVREKIAALRRGAKISVNEALIARLAQKAGGAK
ncbi:MAG: peptidylprolyl isomerase [Deltaproteobacteria bacterium]|nr:peptidylprolyl isomerase [Deltaproteobacteria bacterium]